MSAYLTTRKIRGATVHSYVADTSEEQKKEIIQGALKVCAESKQRRAEENQNVLKT